MLELLNNKEYNQINQILLEKYYDPLYSHTINNIEYQLEIDNDNEGYEKLIELANNK